MSSALSPTPCPGLIGVHSWEKSSRDMKDWGRCQGKEAVFPVRHLQVLPAPSESEPAVKKVSPEFSWCFCRPLYLKNLNNIFS